MQNETIFTVATESKAPRIRKKSAQPESVAAVAAPDETAVDFLARLILAGAGPVAILTRTSRESRALMIALRESGRVPAGVMSLDRCRWGFPGGTVLWGCCQVSQLRRERRWGALLAVPGAHPRMIDAAKRALVPGAEVFGL